MKKYGDVVTLVRNGVLLNAIVAQSAIQPDGEHLTVLFLDPAFDSPILSGSALQRAVSTAFAVPFKEGQANGWREVEVLSEHDLLQMQANSADNQAKNDALWEKQIEGLKGQLKAPRFITFGEGQIVSTTGTSNGFPAVVLEPAKVPGTVGADASGNHPQDSIAPGAVVLEFHNAEGAQVLIEDLAALYPGGGPPPTHPGVPSAADLDAVAAEQRAVLATSGPVQAPPSSPVPAPEPPPETPIQTAQ